MQFLRNPFFVKLMFLSDNVEEILMGLTYFEPGRYFVSCIDFFVKDFKI